MGFNNYGANSGPQGPVVSVFLNRGDGRLQPRLDYPTRGTNVDIADVNGDGKADVVTSGTPIVSVLMNEPGLCNVQYVKGMTAAAAKQTLARANCRVGKIRRAHSRMKKGRVISQRPKFGAVLQGGAKVNLVISRGRRR